ncbi:MAG: 3-methyladenine DNA glycosylase [Catenulispora sp.]|nr:3-methyladenine DNA glycosylase [Catenulispora sp.]
MSETVLSTGEWRARRAAHESRVDSWVGGHLTRRQGGVKHPVEDFLFTYYSYRPGQLRRWHPGHGVILAEGEPDKDYVRVPGGVTLDPALPARRAATVAWIRDLLAGTASRPAQLGCFGMHEWAMVYRQTQEQVRHNAWPLRLSPASTAAVVEERGVRCSHFDAYRFFTEPARPLNVLTPTRERQPELEQPGCLHANMDLYKWAYKLSPLVPSEIVADCFELSREIRVLDMRASPYDLADLGYAPVCVETPEGRQEYAQTQRSFADRAAPLRTRLVEECDRLLTALDAGPPVNLALDSGRVL